jgi:hypothetical protein
MQQLQPRVLPVHGLLVLRRSGVKAQPPRCSFRCESTSFATHRPLGATPAHAPCGPTDRWSDHYSTGTAACIQRPEACLKSRAMLKVPRLRREELETLPRQVTEFKRRTLPACIAGSPLAEHLGSRDAVDRLAVTCWRALGLATCMRIMFTIITVMRHCSSACYKPGPSSRLSSVSICMSCTDCVATCAGACSCASAPPAQLTRR